MANHAGINEYIRSLSYDPRVLLSVVEDGDTSAAPIKERSRENGEVVICTKRQHTLTKNLDEVAILNPAAGVIFPGALVKADQDLMEGHPTPITLARAPVTLTIDLPGLTDLRGRIMPTNADVQAYLNEQLEEWHKSSGGSYVNPARSNRETTRAYSSQQAALRLGFNAKWAAGKASAQLDVSGESERSVIVGYFKQAFYTVTMNPPRFPPVCSPRA